MRACHALTSSLALDSSGAKLAKLELNKRAVVASSKSAKIAIVEAPGWSELRGNITST